MEKAFKLSMHMDAYNSERLPTVIVGSDPGHSGACFVPCLGSRSCFTLRCSTSVIEVCELVNYATPSCRRVRDCVASSILYDAVVGDSRLLFHCASSTHQLNQQEVA